MTDFQANQLDYDRKHRSDLVTSVTEVPLTYTAAAPSLTYFNKLLFMKIYGKNFMIL